MKTYTDTLDGIDDDCGIITSAFIVRDSYIGRCLRFSRLEDVDRATAGSDCVK